MRKQVYEIGKSGFLKEIYVSEIDGNGKILDEDKTHLISVDPPHGLFKAKWTGTKWIEGATQTEIDELTKVEPLPPTTEERVDELESVANMIILGGI